jgi:hypothetical protein
LAPKDLPRPRPGVKALHPDGVTLTTDRRITWHIFKMKLRGGEMGLDDEMKTRLLKAMQERRIGSQVYDLLR